MLAFAWYLLKVLLCSGILFGYYWIALRNKKFHQYNRFYLLIAVALSWIIPVMRFEFFTNEADQPQMVKLLTVVSAGNEYVYNASQQSQFNLDWKMLAMLSFAFVSAIFFARLLITFTRIKLIIRKSLIQKLDNIYLVFSNAKGTPFSFFRYIFWNENIPIDSPDGQHILKHELAHVQEKHSVDKLFVGLSLIVGWYNPFMWFIKKELNMIHEFIADEKAIKDGDTAAFASMILNAAYSPHQHSFTNPFFYSPLKRRLLMITSSKNPRYTYIRKVAVLPILSIIVFFFAFKVKNDNGAAILPLANKYTVIIDAGHGGYETGGKSSANIFEKDITLQLATLLKEMNRNENIDIVLTRESDQVISKERRLYLTEQANADLLLSLHINGVPPQSNAIISSRRGAEIYVAKNDLFSSENKLFGSIISRNIENVFGMSPQLRSRTNAIYILDQNKTCPAILLECGYITNEKDLDILTSKNRQKEIAEGLLKSIEEYFYQKENDTTVKGKTDTNLIRQNMEDVTIVGYADDAKKANDLRDGIVVYSTNAPNPIKDTIIAGMKETTKTSTTGDQEPKFLKVFTRAENPPEFVGPETFSDFVKANLRYPKEAMSNRTQGPVSVKFIVDEEGNLSDFKPLTFLGDGLETEAIRLIKSSGQWKPAVQNGKKVTFQVVQEIVFSLERTTSDQTEQPAEFPGGTVAWKKYLERNLNAGVLADNKAPAGTYTVVVKFNVSKTGFVSNIRTENKPGFGTEKEAVRIVKTGPKWHPAIKDGRNVDSEVLQKISFMVTED